MMLAVGGAIALVFLPLVGVLIWQHRGWRRTEDQLDDSQLTAAAFRAALDASPDGYFAWLEGEDDPGTCSRRLAVLLDLYRGLEATFDDVLGGFDRESADRLTAAVDTLRHSGTGFSLELLHAATGRRIDARGVRAGDADAGVAVDLLWMSDITEGVAAVDTLTAENQDLKDRQEKLTSALDGLTSPVWLRDDDLSLIYCNAAYVRAVDAADSDDVVSRGREIAPRASVREIRALAAAARASGVTRSAPFHMVIDGSRRLMEVTESPVAKAQLTDGGADGENTPSLFGDGSGMLTAGIAYDITRQEELDTRLGRETTAHAEVLERLGTAIAVFGADQRLAFHNTAYTQLWRLDPGWLRDGPAYGDVLEALRDQRRLPEVADFPAFKEKELDRFHALITPLEDVLHLPDGMTLRRVIAPHPMGGLLTTYEDVTDTLAMERSYNTLIAVQRETIDNLSEAIAVFTEDGLLQLANPAFLTLWSLPDTLVAEQPTAAEVMDLMARLFDDHGALTQFRALMLGALSPDAERIARQAKFARDSNTVIEVGTAPLPDGGVLFSFDDVSDPARVESALRIRAQNLSTNERLRSAFVADAMDEMRAPISALADKAAKRSKSKSAAAEKDTLNDLMTLIDDIRGLAALYSDQDTLTLDSFDLPAALETVESLTTETFKARGWSMDTTASDDAGWMIGDQGRICQMIYHCILCALNGAPAGSAAAVTVSVDGAGTDTMVVFAVTGPPVGDRDSDQQWTGLSLVKHIADLHGGYVNSTTGEDGARSIICAVPSGT
jgi:PAS domain-containing protein